MTSVSALGGVTDYLMQVNRLREQANQQAARQQALTKQYGAAVTDHLLNTRIETVQKMLAAGEIEFKTGLIINTVA